MIRTATERDLAAIRALIKSIPDFWHHEWRRLHTLANRRAGPLHPIIAPFFIIHSWDSDVDIEAVK